MLYCVSTAFWNIKEEKNTGVQMSQSSDSLHFDGIPLIKRMVEDSGSVDNLPARVLVISMTDEKTLSSEGIWLNINVCIGQVINQTRFTNIGEPSKNEGPGIGVNSWKSTQMLSDFFQIAEGWLELLDKGTHSTESCSLQLFAPVEGISILQKSHIICSNYQ